LFEKTITGIIKVHHLSGMFCAVESTEVLKTTGMQV